MEDGEEPSKDKGKGKEKEDPSNTEEETPEEEEEAPKEEEDPPKSAKAKGKEKATPENKGESISQIPVFSGKKTPAPINTTGVAATAPGKPQSAEPKKTPKSAPSPRNPWNFGGSSTPPANRPLSGKKVPPKTPTNVVGFGRGRGRGGGSASRGGSANRGGKGGGDGGGGGDDGDDDPGDGDDEVEKETDDKSDPEKKDLKPKGLFGGKKTPDKKVAKPSKPGEASGSGAQDGQTPPSSGPKGAPTTPNPPAPQTPAAPPVHPTPPEPTDEELRAIREQAEQEEREERERELQAEADLQAGIAEAAAVRDRTLAGPFNPLDADNDPFTEQAAGNDTGLPPAGAGPAGPPERPLTDLERHLFAPAVPIPEAPPGPHPPRIGAEEGLDRVPPPRDEEDERRIQRELDMYMASSGAQLDPALVELLRRGRERVAPVVEFLEYSNTRRDEVCVQKGLQAFRAMQEMGSIELAKRVETDLRNASLLKAVQASSAYIKSNEERKKANRDGERDVDNLKERIRGLQQELATCESDRNHGEGTVANANMEAAVANRARETAEDLLANCMNDKEEYKSKIRKIEQKLEEAEKNGGGDSANQALEECQNEVERLREREKTTAGLKREVELLKRRDDDRAALQSEIERLRASVNGKAELEEELKILKRQIQDSSIVPESSASELQRELTAARRKIEILEEVNQTVNGSVESFQRLCAEQQKMGDQCLEEKETLRAELKESGLTVESLSNHVSKMQEQARNLKKRLDEAEDKGKISENMKQNAGKARLFEIENEHLRTRIKTLEKMEPSNDAMDENNAKREEMEAELKLANEEMELSKAGAVAARAVNDGMRAEIDKLRRGEGTDLDKCKNEKKKLRDEIAALEAKIVALEARADVKTLDERDQAHEALVRELYTQIYDLAYEQKTMEDALLARRSRQADIARELGLRDTELTGNGSVSDQLEELLVMWDGLVTGQRLTAEAIVKIGEMVHGIGKGLVIPPEPINGVLNPALVKVPLEVLSAADRRIISFLNGRIKIALELLVDRLPIDPRAEGDAARLENIELRRLQQTSKLHIASLEGRLAKRTQELKELSEATDKDDWILKTTCDREKEELAEQVRSLPEALTVAANASMLLTKAQETVEEHKLLEERFRKEYVDEVERVTQLEATNLRQAELLEQYRHDTRDTIPRAECNSIIRTKNDEIKDLSDEIRNLKLEIATLLRAKEIASRMIADKECSLCHEQKMSLKADIHYLLKKLNDAKEDINGLNKQLAKHANGVANCRHKKIELEQKLKESQTHIQALNNAREEDNRQLQDAIKETVQAKSEARLTKAEMQEILTRINELEAIEEQYLAREQGDGDSEMISRKDCDAEKTFLQSELQRFKDLHTVLNETHENLISDLAEANERARRAHRELFILRFNLSSRERLDELGHHTQADLKKQLAELQEKTAAEGEALSDNNTSRISITRKDEEIAQLNEEISRLRAQITSLQAANNDQTTTPTDTTAKDTKIRELEAEILGLNQETTNLWSQITSLQAASRNTDGTATATDTAAKDTKIQKLEAEIADLKDRQRTCVSTTRKLKEKVEDLQTALAQAGGQGDSDNQAEVNELQKKIDELQEQYLSQQPEIRRLHAEVDRLNAGATGPSMANNGSNQAQIAELQRKIDDLQETERSLRSTIGTLGDEKLRQRDTIVRLGAQLDTAISANIGQVEQFLRDKFTATESESEACKVRVAQLQRQIKMLKKERCEFQAEITRLKDASPSRADQANSTIHKLENEITGLRLDLATARSAATQTPSGQTPSTIRRLVNEIDELKIDLAIARSAADQGPSDQSDSALRRLQTEIAQLRLDLANARSEADQAIENNRTVKGDAWHVERENQELKGKNNDLKDIIRNDEAICNEDKERLRREIQQLKDQARSSTSDNTDGAETERLLALIRELEDRIASHETREQIANEDTVARALAESEVTRLLNRIATLEAALATARTAKRTGDPGQNQDGGSEEAPKAYPITLELALHAVEMALKELVHRRALAGFIENDSDFVVDISDHALGMANLLGDDAMLARTHFWAGIVSYYADYQAVAIAEFDLAAQTPDWKSQQPESELLEGWQDRARTTTCTKDATAYGGKPPCDPKKTDCHKRGQDDQDDEEEEIQKLKDELKRVKEKKQREKEARRVRREERDAAKAIARASAAEERSQARQAKQDARNALAQQTANASRDGYVLRHINVRVQRPSAPDDIYEPEYVMERRQMWVPRGIPEDPVWNCSAQ